MTTIHERIKIARQQRKLSIEAAAREAGVSRQAWWCWEERGASPKSRHLPDVARTLGVGLDYLVGAP